MSYLGRLSIYLTIFHAYMLHTSPGCNKTVRRTVSSNMKYMTRFALIVAVSLLLSQATRAQDIMTAEQLLERSRSPEFAVAVAMYISGWRDGASRVLIGDNDALGRCLQRLEVADLHSKLDEMQRTGNISPGQSSAPAALFNAAVELCEDAIETALAELPRRD